MTALQRVAVQGYVVSARCGGVNTIDARSAALPGSVLFLAKLRGKITGANFRSPGSHRLLAVLLVLQPGRGSIRLLLCSCLRPSCNGSK